MKRVRKVISFMLAAVMVLSLSLTAMAADLEISGTITGKQYDLYQVLDLSQSGTAYTYTVNEDFEGFFEKEDEDAKIIDPNDNSWEDPIAKIQGMGNNSEALSQLAKKILAWADANNVDPVKTVTGAADPTIVTGLDNGYYLLNPLGAQGSDGTAVTMFSLNTLSGNENTITVKAVYPTIDKKVNGSDGAVDAVIGETVTFTLASKVPDMTGYNEYYFIVEDTMSEGLLYNSITSIEIGGTPLAAEKYEATTTDDNGKTKLKIVFKDFIDYQAQAGEDIEITYTAKVDSDAVINGENTNDVKLTYSNDPKYTYQGDKPSDDTSGNTPPTGETPIDEVYVYTTSLLLHKVDEEGEDLPGASFRITGESLKVNENATQFFVEDTEGDYWELLDGTFTTTDPTDDGVDASTYVDPAVKYSLKQSSEINYESEVVYQKGAVDPSGNLTFSGLGAGTYTITEIVTPEGYNSIEPFTVTITFDEGNKVFTYTKDGGASTSVATEIEVVNRTGSLLPSTGGMGTTIFYIVGGALVLFAVVLLVTKKRMKED